MCATKDRKATVAVVLHLAECRRRRAFVELGYSSLYDYATRGLGYSRAAGMRRIRAARCIARFCPQPKRPHDRIRAVAVARRAKQVELQQALEIPSNALRDRGGSNYENAGESELELLHRIAFCAGQGFMRKLERARELMRNRGGGKPELEAVLEGALDEYLKRYCPKEKRQRRIKREQGKKGAQPGTGRRKLSELEQQRLQAALAEVAAEFSAKHRDPRYVPAAVREQVLERDGHQCTYVSVQGVRCAARWGLELDHVQPVGKGGSSELRNLRTLCRAHNLLMAEREFGWEKIDACRSGGVGCGCGCGGGGGGGGGGVEGAAPPPQ